MTSRDRIQGEIFGLASRMTAVIILSSWHHNLDSHHALLWSPRCNGEPLAFMFDGCHVRSIL